MAANGKNRVSLCILSYECVYWGDRYDTGYSNSDCAGAASPRK